MPLKKLVVDESGQILKQVIKIGLIVAVVILILSEAGPLVVYRITGIQDAEDMANEAAYQYGLFQNEDQARSEVAAKLQVMGYSDEEISESVVQFLPAYSAAKTSVKVTLVKYVNTLLTRHIGALKRFSRVAITREANMATAEKP